MKQWTRKRWFAVIGAGVFLIAVIAVVIGLIFGPGTTEDPETRAPRGDGAQTSELPSDEADAGAGLDVASPAFDDSGLVEMEVTTDPRVAAASAAQVLSSADTTKIQWVDDFRTEVLSRVMRPSPEYVGAGEGLLVHQLNGETLTGDDLIEQAPTMLGGLEYSPTGWWWMLGDGRNFPSFANYHAVIEAEAVEVYDSAEMDALVGGASWTKPNDMTEVNIADDASFGMYWVRLETTVRTDHGETIQRDPVALSIYCDPPSAGGVCGVASLMTRYPEAWQNGV